MSNETLILLRGLAYDYCNENKSQYVDGHTLSVKELNKLNFEKLSAFLSWIEATGVVEATELQANTKPKRKLAQKSKGNG